MINRIFKTILVLTICLGLTIPTNAAVSVSDGSAFVTKAEFAADLNNLSNRMAQLENSLDAKIDSLVSSYLTRNGIWNGAKQTVSSGATKEFWPATLTLSGSNATYNNHISSGDWIPELNKSGMLATFFEYKNKSGSLAWDTAFGYQFEAQGANNDTSDNGMTVVFEVYKTSITSANLIYSMILFNQDGFKIDHSGARRGGCVIPLPVTYVRQTFTVFVSKGDKIMFGVREIARFMNLATLSKWSGNNSKLVLHLDESPYIY